MDKRDVVIIGAGVAGLYVARLLAAAGRSTVVIEARDRVGGRLLSTTGDRGRFDLGATWFWPGENRVERLGRALGVGVHDQYLAGDAIFHDGHETHRLSGNPLDVAAFRWSDGAQSLTERLAEDLPEGTVVVGQAATTVTAESAGLIVATSTNEYIGAHVVVAVPPSLAMATLEFSPALPEPFAVMARATPVWMGAMTKVVVQYEQPFWRAEGLAGAAFSHVGPARELHDMSGPDGSAAALFGFCPGAAPGGPPVTEITDQLVGLFGPEAGRISAIEIQDWRSERWTSPADVEALDDYRTYGHPLYADSTLLDGRLHWASTETAPVAPGHVEGALAAAERTATTILRLQAP